MTGGADPAQPTYQSPNQHHNNHNNHTQHTSTTTTSVLRRGSVPVLGQGSLHARCLQTVLVFRRAKNCGVPQLQFWTRWTCPLLRRQVHWGAVLEQSGHARCCDDRCIWVSTGRKLQRFRSCSSSNSLTRSSTFLSWRRCRFPWSVPLRFSGCSTLIR